MQLSAITPAKPTFDLQAVYKLTRSFVAKLVNRLLISLQSDDVLLTATKDILGELTLKHLNDTRDNAVVAKKYLAMLYSRLSNAELR